MTTLLYDIKEIAERIISENTSILDQILLYGNDNYNHDTKRKDFVIYYKVLYR